MLGGLLCIMYRTKLHKIWEEVADPTGPLCHLLKELIFEKSLFFKNL